jgi:hypothetical protein
MRRITSCLLLIAAALSAVPAAAWAKPYGYVGHGRRPASLIEHAARVTLLETTFRSTVANPAVLSTAVTPARPALPAKTQR